MSGLPLRVPRRLPDEMPLERVFEHRFAELFQRLELQTIGDLRRCSKLSASDVTSLNAHLERCWWL